MDRDRGPAAPSAPRGLRLALAGGGTGGHLVPGLSLVEHLLEADELADLVWFTSGRAVEERVLAARADLLARVPHERVALPLEPPGGGAPSLARLALRAAPTAVTARRALARHGTDVLLGLGGFPCLPAVLAARTLGVPAALFEINAVRGKATRWLTPLVQRVLHAWRATVEPGERHVWTGAPLARSFGRDFEDEEACRRARAALGFAAARPLLLVLGGSQGAGSLNAFVAAWGPRLVEGGLQVLHQTGPGRLPEAGPGGRAPGWRAVEYLDDVAQALAASTLVLCRGGASTLAEVAAAARPAVVVPYPHHADQHQRRNAEELGEGVRVVRDADLGAGTAADLLHLAGAEGEPERRRRADALRGRLPEGCASIARELRALARGAGVAGRPAAP